MEKYYELDPNEVVISEEEQQKIREADYINGKRVIAYIQNKKYKNYNPNEVIIPEEKQQEIREADYYDGKKTIVYYKDEEFKYYSLNPQYILGNYGSYYSIKDNVKCIPHKNKQGFIYYILKEGGKTEYIHKAILKEFFPIKGCEKLKVAHINGNKNDCIYDEKNNRINLAWFSGRNPYKKETEIPILTKEQQYQIKNSDYVGGKRVIVYNDNEEFRIHPKYNSYAISNFGRVYSFIRNKQLNLHLDKKGYERAMIEGQSYPVHRLVLETFAPCSNSNELQVNHIDCNKTHNIYYPNDNKKSNLEWVTPAQNVAHAIKYGHRGLPLIGETHPSHIYTDSQVYKICELIASNKYSNRQIAEQLGIEYTNSIKYIISGIRQKKCWKHISDKFPEIKVKYNRNTYEESEIYKICELLSSNKYTTKQIAEQLGRECNSTFQCMITNIRNKKRWKHISDKFPNIQLNNKDNIYKICELLSNSNISEEQIAKQVGMEYNDSFKTLLYNIRNKKRWKHISDKFPEIYINYNKSCNIKKEKIYKICELLSNNISAKEIAKQVGEEYNNSFTTLLSDIRNKKYWNTISDQFPNIKPKFKWNKQNKNK